MKLIDYLHTYADLGHNVMLIGDSGVGKTSIIEEVFGKRFKKWKYFNAATMNPWVDLVGIPDRELDEESGHKYLTMVQQKDFATDSVEAIFLDELNRAPKKVRQALMDLILNKRINDREFHNLKTIWIAINEGSEFEVDALDPAIVDRFRVQIVVPKNPSEEFFTKKYGNLGKQAVLWWNNLDEISQGAISPRRLEYAINQYQSDMPLEHVLTKIKRGHSQLKNLLDGAYPKEQAVNLFKKKEKNKAKSLLNDEDFFNTMFWHDTELKICVKEYKDKWLNFWLPLMGKEKIIQLLNKSSIVKTFVFKEENIDKFKEELRDYYVINGGSTPLGESIHFYAMSHRDFLLYLENES